MGCHAFRIVARNGLARQGEGGENIEANALLYSALQGGANLATVKGDTALAAGYASKAAAIKSVASIKQNYQRRMAAAEESQKEGIASEAVDALTRAVTDQGLSVEEYTSILEVAQNDPDVRQKIIDRIRPSDR